MRKYQFLKLLKMALVILCCGLPFFISAQDTVGQGSEKVLIENADRQITELDGDDYTQYLKGNVRVIQDSIFMFCDSAILRKNQLIALGEVVIIQNDTLKIFADSLYYDGDNRMAELYRGVVLSNKDKNLFTDVMFYNLDDKVAFFPDTCLLEQKNMKMSSLKASYNIDSEMAFFYGKVTAVDDNMNLKTDSLMYDTGIDRAYFLTSTYIEQGERKIYCEDGYYDIQAGRAYFETNPYYWENDRFAKARSMYYSERDSITRLMGEAFVRDSTSEARADMISMDDRSDEIILEGNANYREDEKLIKGPIIIYNKESGDVRLEGESMVETDEGFISGKQINYKDSIDQGFVRGDAVYRDTTANRRIDADEFQYREKSNYFRAIKRDKRPLFRQLIEEDTLYMSADTLLSAQDSSGLNYINAVRRVLIYKSDLQGMCDSLYYTEKDSSFVMTGQPVVWSDTTQFSADTIRILLRNDEVREIIAISNSFIISQENEQLFNQIKGKRIHAYLDSNRLKQMFVKGNAESLYFLKDDEDAYVGPSKTLCSEMVFNFDAEELSTVRYLTDPESEIIPMSKAGPSEFKLQGFDWQIKYRPMNPMDVLLAKMLDVQTEPKATDDEFEKAVNQAVNKPILPKGSKRPSRQ